MDAETLREYKSIRAESMPAHYDRSGTPHYTARRALEWARGRVRWAAESERIAAAWANAEAAGLVRFRVEFDESATFEDISGDTFRPECHPEINPNVIAREAKAERERIDAEGVFGIVAEYRTHPDAHEWAHGASVWGFVGDDWKGYDEHEAKAEALETLRDSLRDRPKRCAHCGARGGAL